jgi:hypothetical protein
MSESGEAAACARWVSVPARESRLAGQPVLTYKTYEMP